MKRASPAMNKSIGPLARNSSEGRVDLSGNGGIEERQLLGSSDRMGGFAQGFEDRAGLGVSNDCAGLTQYGRDLTAYGLLRHHAHA